MKYQKIVKAQFISRPNRFVAIVDINGKEETVHVKNTGRCREPFPIFARIIKYKQLLDKLLGGQINERF